MSPSSKSIHMIFLGAIIFLVGLSEGFLVRKTIPSTFLSKRTTSLSSASGSGGHEYGLLFDCDGVILETEELHRLAYNAAFQEADLTIDGKPVEWSVEYYGKSINIATNLL